ncbi:thiamine pyrophosphate-dependent enzyme [Dialister hominis]|uniref:thiamine pyrophosphate-dependent enzyme n=1 Tax=Dialister hominis TaxID=2582419 RepID=UPI0035223074
MASPRDYKNTIVPNWCPGCGDYGIQNAISAVCAKKGWANEDITLISGIGCSSRIGGYQYCYGAHTTHGRALPFAQGIKCANKDQHMIVCSGDGDSYAIGLGHAMHAIKRNMDITYLVFDNQVYGLTKGQTSPASDKGFVTKTTPDGNPLTPLDAPAMALAAGATSVAQAYAIDSKTMINVIERAVDHKGFSYVNIFTPCVTFNHLNTVQWYNEHLVKMEDVAPDHDPSSKAAAYRLLGETNSLVTGVIYEEKDSVAFGDIVPSKDVRLIDHVEKPSAELFEDLCKEFR